MSTMQPSRGLKKQRGMTLVEVLVTTVLISVGLLGVAALQLTSLKGNQEASVRSQASALASDMFERMRANRNDVRVGLYDDIDFDETGDITNAAGRDITAWQQLIDRTLPNGAGRIDVQHDAPNDVHIVTIRIRWSERADSATFRSAETPEFQTRTEI